MHAHVLLKIVTSGTLKIPFAFADACGDMAATRSISTG